MAAAPVADGDFGSLGGGGQRAYEAEADREEDQAVDEPEEHDHGKHLGTAMSKCIMEMVARIEFGWRLARWRALSVTHPDLTPENFRIRLCQSV